MAVRWDGFSEEDITKMKSHSDFDKTTNNRQKMKGVDLSHNGKRKLSAVSPKKANPQNNSTQRSSIDNSNGIQLDAPSRTVSSQPVNPETCSDSPLDSTKCSQELKCEKTDRNIESITNIEPQVDKDDFKKSCLTAKLVMPSISEPPPSSINLSDFRAKHRLMEEQNRARKVFLAKALEDRKKQTHAEQLRLGMIQEELQKLDQRLSCDVSIIRNQIEAASVEFMEAQKRYDRAEKEFLEAKLHLYTKLERKELLTHHLCTIIEQNEMRKAQKLSELMEKLQMPETDVPQPIEEESKKPNEATTETKRKISAEIILTPTSVVPQKEMTIVKSSENK
ncbi:RAB6-interacting golgin [Thrips palmi]|uniref:RAB6-interacting golgin n=1 Tax=Thrips palmi TaxID=161013 RepID=A0A6P9AF13_THRPL|nr:RAB6-interacting golgin [Thrips palmi]